MTDSFVKWISLAVAILFLAVGLLLVCVFAYEELKTGWESDSWGGCIFFLLWAVLALIATLRCSCSLHRIVMDVNGVYEKPMLPVRKSRSYQWNEIADWGISYLFSDRFGVQYNGIYFSDRILPIDTKNDKRKKAYHSILLSFEEYDYNR
ncbi:MAG: hypothetical protein IJW98_00315, partial [Clostridia bacterium]|nr:hypothetical protein [Clostridia bacterium]